MYKQLDYRHIFPREIDQWRSKRYLYQSIIKLRKVEIQSLTPTQAEILQVQAGTRAFFVDRLTYTTNQDEKVPAVWFQAIYRQDNYDLQAQLLK